MSTVTVCPDAPSDGGPNWPNDPENHRVGGTLCTNDMMSSWDGDTVKLAAIDAPAKSVQFADAGAIHDGGDDWTGGNSRTRFDAGLTNSRHQPRPAYVTLCKALHGAKCSVKTAKN